MSICLSGRKSKYRRVLSIRVTMVSKSSVSEPFKLISNADYKSFWNNNIYHNLQEVLFCKAKTWNKNNGQTFLITNFWLMSLQGTALWVWRMLNSSYDLPRHFYSPSTWEILRQDCQSEASLGYVVKPYLNNNDKCPVVHRSILKYRTF